MPAVASAPDDLFEALFDLSLTGSILLAPLPDATGDVIDFAYVRLNPAAQRLLALPERPTESFLTRFPHARPMGIFAFYRAAYESGETRRAEFNYQYDGLDNYYHLAARRVGRQLLVSFTDTSEQPRTAVEQALRESQAREQAARAEAEAECLRLHQALMQLPANVALLRGPEHRYDLVNPEYERLFPGRRTLGRPIREVTPEIEGQGFYELLDQVYQTGEPYYTAEAEAWADFDGSGQLQRRYYRTSFQPLRNAQGQVTEILNFAVDVTAQVETRRQVEQLNQELEAHIAARTQELQAAQVATERQRWQWEELFQQAPAGICILGGPNLVYEFVNPQYRAMSQLELLGQSIWEAVPGLRDQPIAQVLQHVYDTGETYVGREVLLPLARRPGAPPEDIYFDLTYLARRNETGAIDGIVVYAFDVTERVLARREREARQEELQRIFAQAPMAITVLRGPEFIIEQANEHAEAVWGRTAAEVLGRPHFEALPDAAGQGYEELLAGVRESGEPLVLREVPIKLARAHTGRPAVGYYDIIFKPLYDAQRQVSAVVVMWTEITDQVLARQQMQQLNHELEARVQERTREVEQAQAATERERALLQAMFSQAPVAIALFRGEEVRVVSANARMAALWGRTPEQVLGQPLLAGVPELQGQGFDDMIREVLATGVAYVGTEAPANIRQDGRLVARYYDFSCQPVYDAQGELLGVINVGAEVTGQVESRRALEQLNHELEARVQERTRKLSEQQLLLSQILSNVPAYIATLSGPAHRYTFFNELYHTHAAERTALGLTVAEVYPEVVEQGFLDLLDQVYATGEAHVGLATPTRLLDRAAGQLAQRYLDFVYQPLFSEQRQVRGILVFALDVTDRVRAQQQVEASQRQVQQLNQELLATNQELHQSNAQLTRTNVDLDTFVYTASHDLKAPITNIEGILDALRDTLPAEVKQLQMVAHLLGLLDHTVGRFRATINQLTDLSRLQQTYNEPPELLRLAPVVADVLADLAPLVEEAAAQVRVDVPAALRVSFAPASLRSVVYNLLSNAVKYRAPERPAQVWLQAEQQPGQVVLRVRDNGLGLTGAQQKRLFGVFQRLHTHVEGTGVGLYMIKRLIENAGATIAVASTAGAGTTFTVSFPG